MRLPFTTFVILSQIFAVLPDAVSNTDRSNAFNLRLLKTIIQTSDNNVVISPMNIKIALIMLIEGTKGRTRHEILSTLELPSDKQELRNLVQQTVTSYSDEETGMELKLVTHLFTGQNEEIGSRCSIALRRYYKSDVTSIDFTNTTNAANVINDWVDEATNHNIPSVVEPSTFSSETAVLLAATLYFKGRWLNSFYEDMTYKGCFNVPGVGCHNTSFMTHCLKLNHANLPTLKAKALELPYMAKNVSMFLFLPDNEGVESLKELAKNLAKTSIPTLLGSFQKNILDINVPKFTIQSKQEVKSVLEQMGIKDVFSENANLSRLVTNHLVRLESFIHNAKIEVTETGTIGAAFSGIVIVPKSFALDQISFNRPFLFIIFNHESNDILFAGQVIRP